MVNYDDEPLGKRDKRGKRPPIDKFRRGREVAVIEAGETHSEPIALNASTQSVVVFSKVFDEQGYLIRRRPRIVVTEEGNAAIISLDAPLRCSVHVLYKIEDDSGNIDDEDWDDVEM